MTGRAESAKQNWPRWQQALLIAVLAVLVCVRMWALADDAAYRAGLLGPVTTTFGGTASLRDQLPDSFFRVTKVVPGGPTDKAGIRIGDAIKPYPLLAGYVRQPDGAQIPVEVIRDGIHSTGTVTVQAASGTPEERRNNMWVAINKLAAMFTTLIGCVILWRAWGNVTAMLLGAGMIPLHVVSTTIPAAFGGDTASKAFLLLTVMMFMFIHALPLFAMRLYQESVAALPRWAWFAVFAFFAWVALQDFAVVNVLTMHAIFPLWMSSAGLGYLNTQISLLICVIILLAAWRRSSGAARNRNAVIAFALSAYVVGAIAGFAIFSSSFVFASGAVATSLGIFNALVAGMIAPMLLAYAVLRHKLFDLGFAVNRTLVFATITTILLVSFGAIEWAVEHLVPESWHEGSALYSAGIAVGLFLLFHRIRDGVEHFIERLFFRRWQLNEAALKRFVAAAAHVERPEALAANFTAELARFTGGAPAALYTRTPEGHYTSAAGENIDADDPALAALRAEQGAVVPAELGSPIEAALALPMMHQAALAGFVLLGPKLAGEDYRPDEIELLGWATQQVGLDLQAIRVRDLEQAVVTLEARNANLSEILTLAAAAKAG